MYSGSSNFIVDRRSRLYIALYESCVVAATETISRELNVNRVAGGIITAVEMLIFKLRRVESGTTTDVDLRDSGF
jgi:hypothetical protein